MASKTAEQPRVDHAGEVKVNVWVKETDLAKLDAALEQQGYTSRAEWLRDMMRQTIGKAGQ